MGTVSTMKKPSPEDLAANLRARGVTSAEFLERLRTFDTAHEAIPGISTEQLLTINEAMDSLLEAWMPVMGTTTPDRIVAAIQEQARIVAARTVGQPLTDQQVAAINLCAECRLDMWRARARRQDEAVVRAFNGPQRGRP